MKKNKHKGSCFCGNIQFEIKDTGGTVAACHCLDCRKASGAPFMIFIVVEKDNYIIDPGSIQYAWNQGTNILFAALLEIKTIRVQ